MPLPRRNLMGIWFRLFWWAVVVCLCSPHPVWAAAPSRTYTYTTGQTIDPSQVTTNEDNLYTYVQAGVDTYATASITAAAIADGAVATGEILDGTIVAADIATDAVATAEILDGTIVAADIASGAVDAGDMATTGTIADDKVFVADSATAATWRTITNCTDSSGNHLNYTQSTNSFSCGTTSSGASTFIGSLTRDTTTASGTQAVTGVGFQPRVIIFLAAQAGVAGEASIGFDDGGTGETALASQHNLTADSWTANGGSDLSIADFESSTLIYEGEVTTLGSDGFTITWTRTSTPSGTLNVRFLCLR